MLKRSRVSTTPDVSRLANALRGPGMDTRVWCSLAVALSDSEVKSDEGVFVEVKLLPTGEEMTCRVASEYAGSGFGLYSMVHKDDEVVVTIPSGDAAEGPIVTKRLWSKADKPPAEAASNPTEALLVVEEGHTLRLITSGTGKVYIKSGDTVTLECDKVRLGDEAAFEKVLLGSIFRAQQTTLDNTLVTQFGQIAASFTALSAAIAALGGALGSAGPLILLPPAGIAIAAAGPAFATAGAAACATGIAAATAAATAVTAFETAGAANQDYLSNIANVKR